MTQNLDNNNIVTLPNFKIENLYLGIKQALLDHGTGVPVASIIGCLELMKDEVKRIALEE